MTFGRSEIHFVNPIFGAKSTGAEYLPGRSPIKRNQATPLQQQPLSWGMHVPVVAYELAENAGKNRAKVRGDRLSFMYQYVTYWWVYTSYPTLALSPLMFNPSTVGFCQGTWQFEHMRPLTSSALGRVWFRWFETFQKDAPLRLVGFYPPGN